MWLKLKVTREQFVYKSKCTYFKKLGDRQDIALLLIITVVCIKMFLGENIIQRCKIR